MNEMRNLKPLRLENSLKYTDTRNTAHRILGEKERARARKRGESFSVPS